MSSNVVTSSSVASAARMAGSPKVPIPAAPYRGLEPFRYVDNAIFFARERELRKLIRYITMYRAVLLYGDSGSGKSSLINAGLIPATLKEGLVADRIRVQPREDEEFIIERMPQASNGSVSFLPSNFTEEDYKSTSRIVVPAKDLKRIVENFASDKTPLLIFDQFEELVTLFEESPPNKDIMKALAIQEAILKCLVDLNSSHHLRVKLLFVFREDYLAKLTKFFVKCPDLADHYQRLTPPPKNALQSIIRGPFEKFPGQFGTELSTEIAHGLSQQIISGTESSGLNLSEVQIVCLKLWSADDPKTLLTKRNIQGILEDFLSESLNTLSSDLRQPALALLRKMVTSSGTRNVISEDDLIQLVRKEEKFATEHLKKALEALVTQTKLVRRERRQDVITYQLVSEFLIPWIKQQQQVQQARLVRRRAIRWIGLSLFVALITVAASFYVWRFRTKQALGEAAVRDLTAQLAASQAEQANAQNENYRLLNLIQSGNSDAITKELGERVTSLTADVQKSKNDYSQLKSQADNLQAERDDFRSRYWLATGEKELLYSKYQTLKTRLDAQSTELESNRTELANKRTEVTALTGQVKTLTNDKALLIREIEDLKAKIPPPPPGRSPGPVFEYDALGEGKKVVLSGEEFSGLLTLRLGDVQKKNKPIYIYKTDADEDDENARITKQYFPPSKTNFTMDFQYDGKRYRLEGRIAGELNSTLRDIKIWRL